MVLMERSIHVASNLRVIYIVVLMLFFSGCTYYGAYRIQSEPPGAMIYDMASGIYLGTTPFESIMTSQERSNKQVVIRGEIEGYDDARMSFVIPLKYLNELEAQKRVSVIYVIFKNIGD